MDDILDERKEKILRQIKAYYNAAKYERRNFEFDWSEVAKWMLPSSYGFFGGAYDSTTLGTSHIYDDTAMVSVRKSAAALYGYLANPATNWFAYTIPFLKSTKADYKSMLNSTENKEYLKLRSKIVLRHINEILKAALFPCLLETIAFGTSAIYIGKSSKADRLLTGRAIPLRQLYILSDADNDIRIVFRVFKLNADQAVATFGYENVSDAVKDTFDCEDKSQSATQYTEYVHAVYERKDRDLDLKNNMNKPYASIYMDLTNNHLISESGYDYFPYGIARINCQAGDLYAMSPGMNVIHTVKSVNKQEKQKLDAGDMGLTPPMNVPEDSYVTPLIMKPAALNFYTTQPATPMSTLGAGLQVAFSSLEDNKLLIKEGLYDTSAQVTGETTYEVSQEQIRQLIMMASWQGAFEHYLLEPLIRSIDSICEDEGLLPDLPEALKAYLKGTKLQIDYITPLAIAQKMQNMQGLERFTQFAGNLAPVGGMEVVKIYDLIKEHAELNGVDTSMLMSDNEYKKLQDDKRKAAEAQAAAAQAEMLTKQTKEVGAAANQFGAAMR